MNERAMIDRAVREATMPDGRPRFYPPGKHPAYARSQAMLEKLREFERRTVFPTPDLEAAIDYCEQQIAMVEVGQRRDLQAFVEAVRAKRSLEDGER